MAIDFSKIKTYPLASRASKVSVKDFGQAQRRGARVKDFLGTLPDVLAAADFRRIVRACAAARRKRKPILWGIGSHVIKCGLSPVLIDLMKHGFVSGLAMNGSGLIHDFEIAMIGSTSEDVEAALGQGQFGMARETGELINEAINHQVPQGAGLGEALGTFLLETVKKKPSGSMRPKFLQYSLLAAAYRLNIPVTVHVAIGTDIIHNHPSARGDRIGAGSLRDYRKFVEQVAKLNGGGVFLNFGSTVILPEVFLKAVSIIRNTGHRLQDFTTANFDFIQHYRPTQNIVLRPTRVRGAHGYAITGHHELMLPLLAAALKESMSSTKRL